MEEHSNCLDKMLQILDLTDSWALSLCVYTHDTRTTDVLEHGTQHYTLFLSINITEYH